MNLDLIMSFFTGKRIFLLGFAVVLLVAIPLTVFLAQQQQKTVTKAEKSTTLSLMTEGQSSKTISVGEEVTFDIMIAPGTNQVSFVKFTLSYDGTKLATSGAGLEPNRVAFPSVLQEPVYENNTISVTVSIGGSAQNAVTTPTKIGTVTFKGLAPTDGAPTMITFGTSTQVLSIASSDSFNENVLSTTSPGSVTINGDVEPTLTPEPTPEPDLSPTPEPVTPTPTEVADKLPVCTDFTFSHDASASAPLIVGFTAIGNDSDGVIEKATFNFGDGTVEDVTDGGGIGTNAVNMTRSHTYTADGTYTANVIFFDDNSGGASDPSTCTKTITVGATPSATPVPTIAPTDTPLTPIPPTGLPPTGPGQQLMTVGAFGVALSIIGAILLFVL